MNDVMLWAFFDELEKLAANPPYGSSNRLASPSLDPSAYKRSQGGQAPAAFPGGSLLSASDQPQINTRPRLDTPREQAQRVADTTNRPSGYADQNARMSVPTYPGMSGTSAYGGGRPAQTRYPRPPPSFRAGTVWG